MQSYEWSREALLWLKRETSRLTDKAENKGRPSAYSPLQTLTKVSEAFLAPYDIVAPEGGYLVVVRGKYNPGRDWKDAALAAGPDTLETSNVLKVGGLYPAGEDKLLDHETILVNFGPGSWTPSPKAAEYGDRYRLKPQNPRAVFALAEKNPHLDRVFGMEGRIVGTLAECTFDGVRQSLGIWWDGSERKAGLSPLAGVWRGLCWLAFSRA